MSRASLYSLLYNIYYSNYCTRIYELFNQFKIETERDRKKKTTTIFYSAANERVCCVLCWVWVTKGLWIWYNWSNNDYLLDRLQLMSQHVEHAFGHTDCCWCCCVMLWYAPICKLWCPECCGKFREILRFYWFVGAWWLVESNTMHPKLIYNRNCFIAAACLAIIYWTTINRGGSSWPILIWRGNFDVVLFCQWRNLTEDLMWFWVNGQHKSILFISWWRLVCWFDP